MTSLLKILGTEVGGVTPADDISFTKVLGADELPESYMLKN